MHGFAELETAVMERLWSWDRPAIVRELVDDLNEEGDLPYTTVQTVMDNLRCKGLLTRENDGRADRYEPVATQQACNAELMCEILKDSSDQARTLLRFVEHVSSEEADAIRRALRYRGSGRR